MHKGEMDEQSVVLDEKTIKGQVVVGIASPFPQWPGCIYVPRELTPEQFDTWWTAHNQKAPDGCTPERKQYMDRQHLVLEWHIEGVEPHHVTPDGTKLPSARLASFVVAATIPLIDEARSLPNLPGWWSKRASGDA